MEQGGIGHLFFSFNGRITRGQFWISFIVSIILLVVAVILIQESPVFLVLLIPTYYILMTAFAKRLHDLDKTGWLCLLALINIIALFMGIWLGVAEGTAGPNQYGPDPSAA